MSGWLTMREHPAIDAGRRNYRATWAFVDFNPNAFHDAMSGPLRTAPEPRPGEGGCPAINPRFRDQWWRRWWVATDRRFRRQYAIRARRLAEGTWARGMDDALETLGGGRS